jgi:hypothetical protein
MDEYADKCGDFRVEFDADDGKTYIYTQRFYAESLCTKESQFSDFEPHIKILYQTTFSDAEVMEKYLKGETKTEKSFEDLVKLHSTRWLNGHPFAAFVIRERDRDLVAGYEVLGNSCTPGVGETAYLFNKHYHRSESKKHVGYENVGALIWGYGAELYKRGAFVNKVFREDAATKFSGGTPFSTVSATSRIDNMGSVRILEKLGFSKVGTSNKFGNDRFEFRLNYGDFEAEQLDPSCA